MSLNIYCILFYVRKKISTFDEIEKFLSTLFGKLTISEIRFLDNRDKNIETLVALDIPGIKRKDFIKTLTIEDYFEGPIKDAINLLGDMWGFR